MYPSASSFLLSLCVHGMALTGLWLLGTASVAQPLRPAPREDRSTTIHIGDRLYFVARIPEYRAQKIALRTEPKPAPRKAARQSAAPVEAPPPAIPAPARAFIPPAVRENFVSDTTLIQPLSPPDLVPQVKPLPSFEVWTGELQQPKLPKPFVAPGRRIQTPVSAEPLSAPPDLQLVHADPAPASMRANLVLPPTPAPLLDPIPPTPVQQAMPSKVGDPVQILSLNPHPVPPADTLEIPPGNVAARSEGSSTGTGSRSTASSPAAPAANSATPSSATAGSEAAGKTSTATADVKVSGAAAGAGPAKKGPNESARTVILHPPTGSFDAIVVQSSPTDQFPESKDLLTGRPVYTVYISVGSAKDWTFYFCVPGEKSSTPGSAKVVELSAGTPIQAPYPTRLVRPAVAIPAYYNYVLVHGFVNATGHFENLRVVRPVRPDADQEILGSLSGWEFRPAARDGVRIGVEFLLAIPVRGL